LRATMLGRSKSLSRSKLLNPSGHVGRPHERPQSAYRRACTGNCNITAWTMRRQRRRSSSRTWKNCSRIENSLQPSRLRYTMPTTFLTSWSCASGPIKTKPALGEPYADIGISYLAVLIFPTNRQRVNRNCSILATHLVCLQPGSKEPE
jgi:hypothetical protein